ncbi:UDP-4-amino-4,6-dideoxy-N-acetyl-beta-L-altrosamine transaminase [Gracilibacillus ureilyticus]|uniref:UDP-4-amino-4,6-dideoxy-N-acetyl-beta-L-altrosamine transaminase n=1 Tax=Gracilibacillus ureilyticus TaxID=531814 RepID=A0A1H9RTE9_9BACI|nr:UDP-4-amino-4,6-dideoxy-N-acetyl-beta-L-altrosamine transaminase [Gracilibacillus ureilyticus]SER76120.1 UDP-4-amino-4,6-dideoxy-N-acetyl-beta-L-altrosamine transaminase [Gracilibacillus ureilyticus]
MPKRESFLPYGKQWLDEADIQKVFQVLESDWLTTGPMIPEFEQKAAEYVGAKYAVAFSSGTAALHGACFAAGITKGDEVITTPMTFAATSNAVLYQGAIPVFADIDPATYNLSPDTVESSISEKTKAIIAVDFTGQPADYDAINDIAKKHHLPVIADAAHSLGATYKGKKAGTLADMTMFSFHPVKHITTGEGGMITTDDPVYYQRLRDFRSHGITRDPSRLAKTDEPWYYEMHSLGFNYRMTDIQAGLGISQLEKLDHFLDKRRQYANKYTSTFASDPLITPPYQHPDTNSSWHLYVLKLDQSLDRKEIFNKLHAENIGVNVHYIPVYLHPYYQRLGYRKGLCPEAEKLYEKMITLPLFPKMSEKDVGDVIKIVTSLTGGITK